MSDRSGILLVDDIPEQIVFAGSILKDEGYRVFVLTSGTAALKFLEDHRPDLIMLDIKMENIDGLEVCKRLKLNSLTKDIPIIFLTAQTSPEIIKRCFDLGAADYVVKPFIREEFLARVKAQLDNSKQRLELAAANSELRMFCSAVSHDLKSPLNVVKMLIKMLAQELDLPEDSSASEIMGMITEKTDKLTLMIERLLEFSKMCNVMLNMKPLDTESLIRECFDELKLLEPDRDIALTSETLPKICGDDTMIRMLVKNLMTNAFKFTRNEKNAAVSVKYKDENGYDIITVTDNGAGFDMAYADKLFNIFQRLHTDEEFDGTGVGLALCDRIMKRHGGYIRAHGEVGKGASFSLYFRKETEEYASC